MKRLFTVFVLFCASIAAYAAGASTFSGKYKINLSLPGHDNAFYCMFTQANLTIGGYCVTEAGSANATGKLDGQKVTWSYTVKVAGQSFTANYSGTLDASGKVSGSMELPGMPTGIPFKAEPSQ